MRVTSKAIAAAAAIGAASASPIVSEQEASQFMSRQATSLASAMTAAGKEFMGVALTLRGDSTEENIIKSEFNSITPENDMKWQSTEPSQGSFNYGGGDNIVNFANTNNMQIHCHTLVWHSQLPSWVSSGSWSSASLQAVMQSHINNVAGRWAGSCTRWDVVNEALNEDGSYRTSVFYNVIGESYIPIAFQMAAAADPGAELYYNDYNLAYGGAKTQGAARIVQLIQDAGARIDGVGYQGHMVSESTGTQGTVTPSQSVLAGALRMVTDLGVDVAYTEIDIRSNTPTTATKLADAAAAWARMAGACMEVSRCVGMTVWGVSDQYSWVPSTFDGEGSALLWDGSYNEKPAYSAYLEAIGGEAPTTTEPPTSSTTTTTTQQPTTTASEGTAQRWGQCGGINWTGPTACVTPWTCTFLNDWYYQCL